MKKLIIMMLICTLTLISCNNNTDKVEKMDAKDTRFEGETLEAFYDEMFVDIMNSDPQYITILGDLSEYGVMPQNDQLTINSFEYQSDMKTFYEEALVYLESFGVESTDEAYINYLNVKWFIEITLEKIEFSKNDFFLTHMFGEAYGLNSLLDVLHIIESEEDAKVWIARVVMSEVKIKDMISRYNENTADGYIFDSVSVGKSARQIKSMLDSNVEFMDLYVNFQNRVNELGLSEEKTLALHKSALEAIETYFVPNMENLIVALNDSKSLSETPEGVWNLPDGDDYYRHILKKQTTTSMTPEEVHQLGLSEVKRIQEEMKEAFSELGYYSSLGEMFARLYNNAETYSGQAAMDRYVQISSEMEDQLSLYFYEEDLPISSPNIEVSPGGNYYRTPSIDGKRKGTYFLDLSGTHYDFTINTLAYHETVPGHHFEREHELLLDTIPMIRKIASNTAYVEGWALYAEMFANENGFNPTPAYKLAYLKSELHRAARLVVDTGLHYKKWDRQQGIDYLKDEGLLNAGYAVVEVSRYMALPGQACSYKIGQLKILELRNLMEEAFGDDFDIKEFHHVILANGSMPLDILEEYVIGYIEDNK